MEHPKLNQTDHDLLIRIDTRMDTLLGDFSSYKTTTDKEIGRLSSEKASQTTSDDHERRLRDMEKRMWTLAGVLVAIEIGGGLLLHFWK